MWWVIHMCRGFDPLFSLWQDRAQSFWGIFSHPPTPKRSFGVLKLPILTEFDLLGPKFHFSLDLFGSKFSAASGTPPSFFGPSTPPGPLYSAFLCSIHFIFHMCSDWAVTTHISFLVNSRSHVYNIFPNIEVALYDISVWGNSVP